VNAIAAPLDKAQNSARRLRLLRAASEAARALEAKTRVLVFILKLYLIPTAGLGGCRECPDGSNRMFKFTAATEGQNRFGLRELLQTFADGFGVPTYMLSDAAAEMILAEFKRRMRVEWTCSRWRASRTWTFESVGLNNRRVGASRKTLETAPRLPQER